RDVKLSEERVAGGRNFATKLRQAARFLQMNACALDPGFRPEACQDPINRRLVAATADAEAATREATAWALGQLLHLLHPFMPFVTEELWTSLSGAPLGSLISEPWPSIP